MGNSRGNEWTRDSEVYTPGQVESVLRALGIDIKEIEQSEFKSLCPYHGNSESAVFATSAVYGYSICFNPSCAKGAYERLSLEQLVRDLKNYNAFEAKRFIIKNRDNTSFVDKFDAIKSEPEELEEFSSHAIEKMKQRFWETPAALDYMHGRGFTDETLDRFNVGFTPASKSPVYRTHDMVVVPAYDHKSRPVGLVARSIEGKAFKNFGPKPDGTGFRKSKIVWNLNNARRSETCILTEATFDSMAVDAAGYSNVGALLGGTLSGTQKQLLSRHFTTLVIMTDNENEANGEMSYHIHCAKCLRQGFDMCQGHAAGRELGMQIATEMPGMRIKWAVYDDNNIYANNVKDARGMDSDEIRQCVRNAVSHFDYLDRVA